MSKRPARKTPAPRGLEGRVARLQALTRLNRLITSSLEMDDVLREIARAAATLMDGALASFALVDESARTLELRAWSDEAVVRDLPQRVHRFGEDLTGWVAERRELVSVPDASADPRSAVREWRRAHGLVGYVGVPVMRDRALLAILSLSTRRPLVLSADDRALLEAFAGQAAVAIHNARLYAHAAERAERLATLSALTRLVTSATSRDAVFRGIAEAATVLLKATMAWVWVDDPDQERLREGGSFGVRPDHAALMSDIVRPLRGEGVTGAVLRSRRAEYLADIQQDPRWLNVRLARAANLHACAAIPLIQHDRALGVLVAAFGRRGEFTPEEMDIAGLLADQAAIAIENARLLEDARRRQREAEVVADLARSLGASLDLDTVLQRLVEGARELTGSDMARIALRDPASERFTLRHWVGSIHPAWRDLVLEPGRGLAGQALLTGRSVRTDSYAEDPRFPKDYLAVAREENTVAVMAVPIRGDERIEALLIVIRTAPRPYTDQDEAILSRLADHAAAAIQNARLYAESAARRQSAEALAEVGRVLAGSLDVRRVLDLIVDRSCALLGSERSAVALVATDPSAPDVRFVASRGLSADFHALRPVHSRDGTTALALAERRAVWSADLLNDPAFDLSPTTRARVEAEGYRAVLSLPADQAALALENARLYEESEGQRRGAEAVAEHGRALLETLDPRARGQQTADSARALLGAEVAAVYRLEPATGALRAIVVSGRVGPAFGPDIVLPSGTGVIGVAVRERQPVATPDVLADARITLTPGLRTAIEQAGYRSVLSVPLFV
ncbi:MAG: GAF domain-containing protein, partial [Candidatus Rokubacteria bacterium]|nr:GAF domain-containing protein [Candidatus Rokubacteria bacterium]